MEESLEAQVEAMTQEREVPQTIPALFLRTAIRNSERIAFRVSGGGPVLTWRKVREIVPRLAAGLRRLGLRKGDTVGLLFKNRPEQALADLAAMCIGAIPVSLYPTLPVSQIEHIVRDAGFNVALSERAFFSQLQETRKKHCGLDKIVLLDGLEPETLDWSLMLDEADSLNFDQAVADILPTDLVTIIYTSGTTGPSKGVELTHAATINTVTLNDLTLHYHPGQNFISWLPMAHMAERISSFYPALIHGCCTSFCEEHHLVPAVVAEVSPDVFFAPPRYWEKLKSSFEAEWNILPERERNNIFGALALARQKIQLEQAGSPVPAELRASVSARDLEYFRPLRQARGYGKPDNFLCSGGAPAPYQLLEFFSAIGMPVEEVYGMTESCGVGTRNPRGAIRLGTVGKPQPGVEITLARDGEIQLRAKAIMRGYRNRPEATQAAKTSDGWLHTGDIGRFDEAGYLRIIGRKKDMIINSFGKNISPVNIEAALTQAGPFIQQAMAIGDGRNYIVAIVTLNVKHVLGWAHEQGLQHAANVEELAKNADVIREVEREVRDANLKLARVEQVKRFAIVGGEWQVDSEEMTPTMKIRRSVVMKKYASRIETLYANQVPENSRA